MNGKLYIEDPLTGDVIKIADSMGAGWNLANSLSFDKLAEFLANHDSEASYGACNYSTALRLVTEHEVMARSSEEPDAASAEMVDDPLKTLEDLADESYEVDPEEVSDGEA